MTDLILHSYDGSPFTQRALKMLAIKRARWRWVETPMMLPKDDLVALTGGYRGTPVLQIGADVYIDTQRIARELENRIPQPTLFPAGGVGLDYAMVKWADAFFRAGLHMAIGLTSPAWPAEFRADRQKLFPDIDFAKVDVEHAQSQLRAHAFLIELQLRDGRAFLGGDAPGMLDIHAWTVPWFARPWMPVVNDLLAAFPRMAAWEARVAALGEGDRQPITIEDAFAAARAATPLAGAIEPGDAQGLQAGEMVDVGPEEEMRRGDVRGAVVGASADEIAVRRSDPRCGEVVVHFPRLGYRVRRI
jgi:glutathione S-transferase